MNGAICDQDLVVRSMIFINGYKKASKVKNYLEKIKNHYQPEWFLNQTASWNNRFETVFIETLTRRGYGYTFNMLTETKLFTDEYK